jgi:flavorubredoxin
LSQCGIKTFTQSHSLPKAAYLKTPTDLKSNPQTFGTIYKRSLRDSINKSDPGDQQKMRVFLIYDSKYGNTKLAAQQIAAGLKESGGINIELGYVKETDAKKLVDFDALIFGAPNHMGGPSRTMSKFIDSLEKVQLRAKWAAVFDTYFAKPKNQGKAMKKMEKKLNEKLPNLKIIVPGLSVKVEGVNGPIAEGELSKSKEFGTAIGKQLRDLTS